MSNSEIKKYSYTKNKKLTQFANRHLSLIYTTLLAHDGEPHNLYFVSAVNPRNPSQFYLFASTHLNNNNNNSN